MIPKLAVVIQRKKNLRGILDGSLRMSAGLFQVALENTHFGENSMLFLANPV